MTDGNVQLIQANGTIPAAAAGGGYQLLAGQTYYGIVGDGDSAVQVFQLKCDAAIVLTSAGFEDTAFFDADPLSSGLGFWVPENPTTAYVATTTGAGFTVTNATVAKTAGVLGSALWQLSQGGAVRTRIKIVVGATGGVARVGTHERA